jgi:FixJ family two-component response regulator
VKQSKTSVVLVEDDRLLLRALRRLITLAGYRTLAFDRREEVLRARLPKHRGCIVLDVFMPGMDAVQFFQRLRAEGNQLPIILITGRQDDHSQRIIDQIDCAAVLYKPFTASELLSAIGKNAARAV